MSEVDILKIEGDKIKVRLTNKKTGFELLTMINGFQWAGLPVDDKLLKLIYDTIGEYFNQKNIEEEVKP